MNQVNNIYDINRMNMIGQNPHPSAANRIFGQDNFMNVNNQNHA